MKKRTLREECILGVTLGSFRHTQAKTTHFWSWRNRGRHPQIGPSPADQSSSCGSAFGLHRRCSKIFVSTLQPLLLACGGCGLITHCCCCFAQGAPQGRGRTKAQRKESANANPGRARKDCTSSHISVLSCQQELLRRRAVLQGRAKAKHSSTLQESLHQR